MPSPEARVGPRPELPRCSNGPQGVLLECTQTYRSANRIVNTFECTYANALVFPFRNAQLSGTEGCLGAGRSARRDD
jgi:hypothetical protein